MKVQFKYQGIQYDLTLTKSQDQDNIQGLKVTCVDPNQLEKAREILRNVELRGLKSSHDFNKRIAAFINTEKRMINDEMTTGFGPTPYASALALEGLYEGYPSSKPKRVALKNDLANANTPMPKKAKVIHDLREKSAMTNVPFFFSKPILSKRDALSSSTPVKTCEETYGEMKSIVDEYRKKLDLSAIADLVRFLEFREKKKSEDKDNKHTEIDIFNAFNFEDLPTTYPHAQSCFHAAIGIAAQLKSAGISAHVIGRKLTENYAIDHNLVAVVCSDGLFFIEPFESSNYIMKVGSNEQTDFLTIKAINDKKVDWVTSTHLQLHYMPHDFKTLDPVFIRTETDYKVKDELDNDIPPEQFKNRKFLPQFLRASSRQCILRPVVVSGDMLHENIALRLFPTFDPKKSLDNFQHMSPPLQPGAIGQRHTIRMNFFNKQITFHIGLGGGAKKAFLPLNNNAITAEGKINWGAIVDERGNPLSEEMQKLFSEENFLKPYQTSVQEIYRLFATVIKNLDHIKALSDEFAAKIEKSTPKPRS